MAEEGTDPAGLARAYYEAIDADDYGRLASVLDPGFVHDRGDRTIEGREAFVRFMREERPERDTRHEVARFYDGPGGVAVRGTLFHGDGSPWFEFVDVFRVEADALAHLRTYAG